MIRATLALLLMIATPAWATQNRWPALFDVTGVAGNDALNIRTAPSTGGEIIGTLAHDARNVEVIAPNDRQTWGLVNVDGGTGWVSLHFLARQPGQWLGAPIENARCSGTEPFWSLTRRGDAVTWSSPETASDAQGNVQTTLSTLNRRDTSGLLYRLRDGARGHMVLALERCSDGMSDRAYGISATLTRNLDGAPEMLTGCCTLLPAR